MGRSKAQQRNRDLELDALLYLHEADKALAAGRMWGASLWLTIARKAIVDMAPGRLFWRSCRAWLDRLVRLAELENERRAKGGV